MIDGLASLICDIAGRPEVRGYDEATTQTGIVLPMLQRLGWDVFSPKEVAPQYAVGNGRVDYALLPSRDKKVLCEVKAPSEDLEKHQQQLVKYAFQEGAEIGVLTNGLAWWLYLPMLKVPWERRKFFTVDLMKQSPEDAAERLEVFLSKSNVRSGRAATVAEDAQRGREKKENIEQALPDAWCEIVSEPDDRVVSILCERAEKICGFRPATEEARVFIKNAAAPRRAVAQDGSAVSNKRRPVIVGMTSQEEGLNKRLAALKTHKDFEGFLKSVEAAGCSVYTKFIGREAVEFTPTEGQKRPCMDYVKVRGNGSRSKGQCYVDLLHRYLVVRLKPRTGNPYYVRSRKAIASD